MSKRPLAIVTADPEIEAAAREAAALVPSAVGPVRIYKERQTFEQVASRLEGLAILDPEVFSPQGVHEWALGFLRQSRALLILLTRGDWKEADALARFVGAQGALAAPVDVQELASRLESPFGGSRPPGEELDLAQVDLTPSLGELLEGKSGGPRDRFLQQVTDPETGFFNSAFWEHRLEEEYKRAFRFRYPVALAAFSFDGEADAATLLDAAGVILTDTRDVDIFGRLDRNTFVALLPHTGPAGVEHFARRVQATLTSRGLKDLLNEEMEWAASHAVGPDTSLESADAFLQKVLGGLSQPV